MRGQHVDHYRLCMEIAGAGRYRSGVGLYSLFLRLFAARLP